MDSPKSHRQPIIAASPASSPIALQDSTLFSYMGALSPIESAKARQSGFWFLDAGLPPQLPVFTSPRGDPPQEAISSKREMVAASLGAREQWDTQLNAGSTASFREAVPSLYLSGSIGDTLSNTVQVSCLKSAQMPLKRAYNTPLVSQNYPMGLKEGIMFLNDAEDDKNMDTSVIFPKPNEDGGSYKELVCTSGAQYLQEFVDQTAGTQQKEWNYTSDGCLETVHTTDACGNIVKILRPHLKELFQEPSHHQCSTRRHLRYDTASSYAGMMTNRSHNSMREETYPTNPWSLTAPADLGSDLSFHSELGGVSMHLLPACDSQARASQFSLGAGKTVDACPAMNTSSTITNSGNSFKLNSMPPAVSSQLHGIGKAVAMGCIATTNIESCEYSNEEKECQAVVAVNSETLQSAESVKLINDSTSFKLTEQQTTLSEAKTSSDYGSRTDDLNSDGPVNKRKQATNGTDSGSCKRCSCKKSECLKLYCECFAAGVYCADVCACDNCFNKMEYEDTVLDRRQKIESRNPFAFAPKIVKHATGSSPKILDDGTWMTPSSARHKRGCSCKKSKCRKRYCECFQGKVGCADGCRCEGCQNPFGTKTDMARRKSGKLEKPPEQKLDPTGINCVENFKTPDNRVMEMGCFDRGFSHSKIGREDNFSPKWEGLPDISHFTPSSHPHSALSCLLSPDSVYFSKVSESRLKEVYSQQPSVGSRPRSPSLVSQLYGTNDLQGLGCDNAVHDKLKDSTAAILREAPIPTRAVKVTSPNQKRVSPPHFPLSDPRPGSSQGSKTAWRFFLQGVPSFPPL